MGRKVKRIGADLIDAETGERLAWVKDKSNERVFNYHVIATKENESYVGLLDAIIDKICKINNWSLQA